MIIIIIIIIIMCQVCCTHRQSWPSNPLIVSSPDELIVILLDDSFLVTKFVRLCVLCVGFLCFWYNKSFHPTFAFLVHQLFLHAQNIVVFFLMVLCRDILYPAISITSPVDFSLVHAILIIFLMYHIFCCLNSSF